MRNSCGVKGMNFLDKGTGQPVFLFFSVGGRKIAVAFYTGQ
jgi:hypothetical protein